MPLRMKRGELERIVYEELERYITEQLTEAAPTRGTALDDEDKLPPDPEQAPEEQLPGDTPVDEPADVAAGPSPDEELPTGEEPADDELDQDVSGDEDVGPGEGTVAAELSGKTIESVTLDEESKILPGATEVVLTFREGEDALRLLVTKTGKFKIFYKGLHNSFDSPIEQLPGEEEPEELGGDEAPGEEGEAIPPEEEPGEELPPMGAEDMPPPDEEAEEPTSSRR